MDQEIFQSIFWISAQRAHLTLTAEQLGFLGLLNDVLVASFQGDEFNYRFWVRTGPYRQTITSAKEALKGTAEVLEITLRRSGPYEWRVE